ncbi:helix-turn-helix domain-containing protein [Cellulomonas iranensis]|nr:helix-turn-helix domain-containing protein [Cellulomonas iranensis]
MAVLTAAGVGQRDIAAQVGSTKSTIARAQAALRAEADGALHVLHAA